MPEHNATLKNVKDAKKILASLIDKFEKERNRIIRNKERKEKLNKLNENAW